MVSDRNLASTVGGASARACDSCGRKLATWYCAADDAFLCHSCDSSVHSANPLSRRHERVRLKTTATNDESVPSWHRGFTRKARTPRTKKHDSFSGKIALDPLHDLVPDMCCEEQENEEQLLYRVPIFDPFEVAVPNDAENCSSRFGILPSELDVESFLVKGLEDEPFDLEGLGILDCDENGKDSLKMIKFEENYQIETNFELDFDYSSPITCEEENQEPNYMNSCKVDDSNKSFLKLDYEGVMSAWDGQKSPWTTGERPEMNPGDCWPPCLGTSGAMHVYGDKGPRGGQVAAFSDGGREARVSRYREKRRTRLFSKKIRYEVRKLNAEKRPRMKGRFVKRANFAASAFALLNN